MKTIALTEAILPCSWHCKAASVSARERPQSSAFMISMLLKLAPYQFPIHARKGQFPLSFLSDILFLEHVRLDNGLQKAGRIFVEQNRDIRHDAVTTDHARKILYRWKEFDLVVKGNDLVIVSSKRLTIALDFLRPRNHHTEISSLG